MDDFITVSCQGTPGNLTLLREIAEGWNLHVRSWQLEQNHFSTTYRSSSLISTWDTGYYILDQLLVHQTNKEDVAEVRLQFSSMKGDDAVLTLAEVQVDAPCTCYREQALVDPVLLDQQCIWEADTLTFLPHVSSLVSVANPEPWVSWLPKRCEVRGEGNGVVWYGSVNCNYLVFHQRIIANCGYHGEAVFKKLQCYRCRRRMLREWAHEYAYLVRSNEEWKKRHA
ncbi:MAG: hypothetical protein H0U76_22100 [Ktedonobacteraceae bacterium]|nr:hypothetical protein [Ktedonobacteraceae bacterium]